jgi:hypothetical protein
MVLNVVRMATSGKIILVIYRPKLDPCCGDKCMRIFKYIIWKHCSLH